MRKFLWPLSVFLAALMLLSCQKEEVKPLEPNENSSVSLSTILRAPSTMDPKITEMNKVTDDAPTLAIAKLLQEGNDQIRKAGMYLNPAGDVSISNEKLGDKSTQGAPFVYNFKVEDKVVAYQVSSNQEVYYHEVFTDEGQIIDAKETKLDKFKQGNLVMGGDSLAWQQDDLGALHYQIAYADESGARKNQSVTAHFNGTHDIAYAVNDIRQYEIYLNAMGTSGRLKQYSEDGQEVVYEGPWPTPPPPEDFSGVRMPFINDGGLDMGKRTVANMEKHLANDAMRNVFNNMNFVLNKVGELAYYFNPPETAHTSNTPVYGDADLWCLTYEWINEDLNVGIAYQISTSRSDYYHHLMIRPADGSTPYVLTYEGKQSRESLTDCEVFYKNDPAEVMLRMKFKITESRAYYEYLQERANFVDILPMAVDKTNADAEFEWRFRDKKQVDKDLYDLVPADLVQWLKAALKMNGEQGTYDDAFGDSGTWGDQN